MYRNIQASPAIISGIEITYKINLLKTELYWMNKYTRPMISFVVLLSQKHNRYHYAGEQQIQYYHEKNKTNQIVKKECLSEKKKYPITTSHPSKSNFYNIVRYTWQKEAKALWIIHFPFCVLYQYAPQDV